MAKREFTVENEYVYNRTSPLRWVVSHVWRYPVLPLFMIVVTIINNLAYSYWAVGERGAAIEAMEAAVESANRLLSPDHQVRKQLSANLQAMREAAQPQDPP